MALVKCINPDCNQEIDEKETTCPKCGVVFEELEEEVKVVTRAQRVAEARKTPPIPPAPPSTEPPTPKKRTSIFRSLGKKKG